MLVKGNAASAAATMMIVRTGTSSGLNHPPPALVMARRFRFKSG
jgi:hypothetical protein